ncbi:hypothetical protein [Aquibacillus saliphilus]|uniref:hypothetical protein n=1 Tax=Aquibacillus saliphilus TaxID=1909422 RepID=UPI001CEFB470|nr:hypothetical protein [Aquibacillus saliphilus]
MKKIKSFFVFLILFLALFLYFINQNPHSHSANSENTHDHIIIPESYPIPSIKVLVTQDHSDTWLLKIKTNNFQFAPEKVGVNLPSYNEGHAHLYINEKKINRLYGKYYNLGTLKEGQNKIKVSLHSNNHGALVHSGEKIEDSTTIDN